MMVQFLKFRVNRDGFDVNIQKSRISFSEWSKFLGGNFNLLFVNK